MKLKIILLLDSLNVSAWVYEAIVEILKENQAEIVLVVINKKPKASGKKSPLVYRAYRWIDRKLFLNQPDAFERKNLSTIPNWDVPNLEIQPIQKKFSDFFQELDLAKIRTCQADIILRFGFRIIRGDILKIPRLGVWSFHHGDNFFYRGGPPAFWEVMRKKETTGLILQRLSERLDDGEVLYKTFSQTDPLSVQRNANKVFWLSSFSIARVIRQINLLGIEGWKKTLLTNEKTKPQNVPILVPPRTWEMLKLCTALWSRNFLRKISEYNKKPYWELRVSENTMENLTSPSNISFKSIKPPKNKLSKGSFWADPFPLEREEKTWVFFEEFDARSKKGSIAVAEWDGVALSESKLILEEAWHLSYPFIWEENKEHFLIPESGDAGKIFIYQALKFPFQWKKLGVFFEGEAHDPTLIEIEGMYWLFVNQRPHPGTSAFVELYAYSSPSLLEPKWTPHPLNPIVSDVQSSRPGGRIFKKNGKLYRPAQDSGLRYGHRVKIQEILKLTKTEYVEKTMSIIEPDVTQNMLGTHTFNFTDKWIFSDGYFRK